MLCFLPDIEEFCSASAGLKSIKFYLPEDVQAEPQPIGCELISTVEPTMKSGKTPYSIPADIFSGTYQCRSIVDTAGGDYFQHNLNFQIRRNRSDVATWLLRLKNRRVHVRIEDWNSTVFWVKNMRFGAELNIEAKIGGKNAFAFSLSSKSLTPPIYIELPTVVTVSRWQLPDGSYWLMPDDSKWLLPN